MSYVNPVSDIVLRYISRVYIYKRAGTSDILTFLYATALLVFGLTFAGTV